MTALEHQPDPGRPLGAWVTTVLRNNLAKLRRRDSNREHRELTAGTADAADYAPATLDVVEKAATHRNLVEAVLSLDEPYRTTVLLRFFEQRSYREIAKQAGASPHTIRNHAKSIYAKLGVHSQPDLMRHFRIAWIRFEAERGRARRLVL